MGSKKGAAKRKGNLRPKQEKRDNDIMNTNDSSIVSKRSVSKLYLTKEPDFYEPFVPKFVRRNPLINRGYWLRMHAIEQVVLRFLQEENGKPKIVVNLGCGYDPLPFQFWHRYASLTQDATFVDVDYPQLMEKKRDRMLTNNLLRDALFKTKLRSSEPPVYLRSDRYLALGCDLRDLQLLERVLRTEFDVPGSSILFVAEVSVTYMPLVDSDALIRWASTLEDARFCILEQYLPQGPEHPFAKTMLNHFDKLQTSIKAVERYLSLAEQSTRFLDAGWPMLTTARNLWDLWSDDQFTPVTLRRKLDAIEPFDEWEEFALFGGHYFLLVASNAKTGDLNGVSRMDAAADIRGRPSADSETVMLNPWRSSGEVSWTPRRFTAAFKVKEGTVAFHGGQGPQNRLANLDVLTREDPQPEVQADTSPPPHARMCHTITSISDVEALLVGGRASPTNALPDCWLIKNGAWSKVYDLTTARYRHCAVAVTSNCEGSQIEGVLVFSGKASDGTVLDDWQLWTANDGWHSISVDGPRPSARFGAAISTIGAGQDSGLLAGGIGSDGTVLEDIWEWSISLKPQPRLILRDCTNRIHCKLPNITHARIGASLVPWGDALLMVGGVSKKEIHSLSDDFLVLTLDSTGIHVEQPIVHVPSAWPLLVGMGTVAVSRDEIVIAGGGAVCFSMGSFWNEGHITITRGTMQGVNSWRPLPPQVHGTAQANTLPFPSNTRKDLQTKAEKPASVHAKEVTRVQLHSAEDFAHLVAASKPAIIEGLDIGPCTGLWTLDYLKENIGAERELIIHDCSSDRMTFKDKNFQYVKRSVSDFFDGIATGSKAYLRAVSSSQPNKLPTKLEDDFPSIAADFRIPEIFEAVKSSHHSSPLRISGPVSLWLHYDVLANVLCQIRGSKTLYLYPPSDVKHLDFPPGGSSSNIDVLTSKNAKLKHTHPHKACIKPGDILFIPPMWSHTATPEEGVSVAVNVFWRNLDVGYAAGKDVYGNRDLQAYENGRRDVEKITRAFREVPGDMAKFYLDRLAGEIQDAAEKNGKKGLRGQGDGELAKA
ncbi:LCM-domain-containing protein [Dothidotthia symphoricarpi CBS 119687]|uniref:tRNA wybutosine-synthesizing protein 4 n=1 Tax=Dothidotthia symphoricarpi CBS 119687 TaxID=1392245 RepID=A0A6A6AGP1_9PLEO|nr:LCM-domain-containing protein [Dothidotthia symphoricarpi CBS 119687]KAF2129601.1 LCM-domain-containing protein [Dothidotthia symphoricarpi CBS 119687]